MVNDAIRDGQARPYVRDLAAWVVTLLRAHHDHGWVITPPAPPPDSPEALREAFACYAAEQEAKRRDRTDEDQRWSAQPTPALVDRPDARIQLWHEVLSTLKLQLTRQEFETWFGRTMLHSITGGKATIVVPNRLVKEAIESRYLAPLRELLTMQVGEAVMVQVILQGAQHDDGPVLPLAPTVSASVRT